MAIKDKVYYGINKSYDNNITKTDLTTLIYAI